MTNPASQPLAPAAFAAGLADGLARVVALAHDPRAPQHMPSFVEVLGRMEAQARELARHLAQRETVEDMARDALAAHARQRQADDEQLAKDIGPEGDAELAGPHGPALAAKRMAERDPLTWRCLSKEIERLRRLAIQPVPAGASRMERVRAVQFAAAVARVCQLRALMAGLLASAAQAKAQHDRRAGGGADCVASMATADALAAFLFGFADLREKGLHEPSHELAAHLVEFWERHDHDKQTGAFTPKPHRPRIGLREANRRVALAIALDAFRKAGGSQDGFARALTRRLPSHGRARQGRDLAEHVTRWREDFRADAKRPGGKSHPVALARWRDYLARRDGMTHAQLRQMADLYLARAAPTPRPSAEGCLFSGKRRAHG